MNFYTTTVIHLSLEEFHNQGMSSEETKQVIENIVNPFQGDCFYSSNDTLKCKPQYINGNWNVEILTNNPKKIYYLVDLIEMHLLDYLKKKNKNKKYQLELPNHLK